MLQVSVVIITKNEAGNIRDCILSAKAISDDVIVVDSGSTDDTVKLAKALAAKVVSVFWRGYGESRNTGASLASNDWILSLDADERITPALAGCISAINFNDITRVYGFRRLNYFGLQKIKHGTLGHDRVYRLYNRIYTQWNTVPVHEKLENRNLARVTLKSPALHFSIQNKEQYIEKKMRYAQLCAAKYRLENRKATFIQRNISPVFNFIQSYVCQLGFLDGGKGLDIAMINFAYTRKKYELLYRIWQNEKSLQQDGETLETTSKGYSYSFFKEIMK